MIRVEGRNISDPNFGGSNARNMDTGRFSSEIAEKLSKSLRASMEQASSRDFKTTRISAATASFGKGLGENTLELQKLISNQTEEFTKNFNDLIDSFKKNDPITVLKSIEKTLKTLDEDTAKQLEEKLNLKEIRKGLIGGATIKEKFNKFMGADSDKGPIEGIKQVFAEPERLFGAKRGFLGTGLFSGGEEGIKRQAARLMGADNVKDQASNLANLKLGETITEESKKTSKTPDKKDSTFSSGIDKNDSSKAIMDELKKQTTLLEEIAGKPAGGLGGGLPGAVTDIADVLDGPDRNNRNRRTRTPRTRGPGRLARAANAARNVGSSVLNAGRSAGSSVLNAGRNLASKIPTKALLKGGLRAAGNAAKFIPGVGLAVGAGMAAFDGFGGFNADENASLGQKFKNAGSSVLSGLTFGMLGSSPEEIAARAAENPEATEEVAPNPQVPVADTGGTPAAEAARTAAAEIGNDQPKNKPDWLSDETIEAEKAAIKAIQSGDEDAAFEAQSKADEMLYSNPGIPTNILNSISTIPSTDPIRAKILGTEDLVTTQPQNATQNTATPITPTADGTPVQATATPVKKSDTASEVVNYSTEEQIDRAKELAKQMDMNPDEKIDFESFGTIPSIINGVNVPNELLTEGEISQRDAAMTLVGGLQSTPSASRIESSPLPTGDAIRNATDAASTSGQQTPPIINNITNNNVAGGGGGGGGVTVAPATIRDTRNSVQRLQDRAFGF